ncbi:MAG: DUF4864 domain-containing protein, partial [Cytophagales bacterium]|nr:DUF4864 domain-containing protein [Armatimonadota bacterium]
DAAEEETPPSVVAPPKRTPSASKPPKRKAAPGPRIADAKTQAALQKVVQGQLAAFAKDDFAAALRYSAPDFRRTWSPESFRQMVLAGYAGLMNSRGANFSPARCNGDIAMMPVRIKQAGGAENGFLYILHREITSAAKPAPDEKTAPGEKPSQVPGKTAAKPVAPSVGWYIEGVSPLGDAGVSGGAAPGRMLDVREI